MISCRKDVSQNTDGRIICGFCSASKIQTLEVISKKLELKNTHSAMCEPIVARNATLASGWSTPLRPASARLLEMKGHPPMKKLSVCSAFQSTATAKL
ncbi:hypothetical protein GJ496_008648 [Pomphorhynchus laevis]|nr:hypothetical protein GJ496_008648 [Pomphorhynchus laevis]